MHRQAAGCRAIQVCLGIHQVRACAFTAPSKPSIYPWVATGTQGSTASIEGRRLQWVRHLAEEVDPAVHGAVGADAEDEHLDLLLHHVGDAEHVVHVVAHAELPAKVTFLRSKLTFLKSKLTFLSSGAHPSL